MIMKQLPHYFIAIPLSTSIKRNLAQWQIVLKQSLGYHQWVHPEDLHITLKFLGAIQDSKLLSVVDELSLVQNFNTFSLHIGSLGTFGHPHRPRVLWASVERNSQLMGIQAQVEEQMLHVGFEKETRTFRPHVTLTKRWSGSPNKNNVDVMREQFREKSYLLPVEEVVLYQIFPKQTPKYKVVSRYELRED